MRPATLSEALARIIGGTPREIVFAEVLDTFGLAADDAARCRVLADEPAPTGDRRLDALAGGLAEYLAKQRSLPVPPWASEAARYLADPWFPGAPDDAAIREYLAFASPGEFKSRNIFCEARPFRRAKLRPPSRGGHESART